MPTPDDTLPPDPLDPIVANADNLHLNRAITTAPNLLSDADLDVLIDVIRRDRARFNVAERKREEGDEEPALGD